MKRLISAVLVSVLFVAGCETVQELFLEPQSPIRIQGDVAKVLVRGCQKIEKIEVDLAMIQDLLPEDTTVQKVKEGLVVGQEFADKICSKIVTAHAVK